MRNSRKISGLHELRAARRRNRTLFWVVALFSAFANLLMLTGPLYMLQVYDRVLSSGSVETLVGLTLIVAFLYAGMGGLDYLRGRILARVAARFQARLERRVFHAVLENPPRAGENTQQTGLADLDAVQRFIASPLPPALFDLPWTPIFLLGISLFHPWLGILAFAGGAVLTALAYLNQLVSRSPISRANATALRANSLGEQQRNDSEMLKSLGLQSNAFERWHRARSAATKLQIAASDIGGQFNTLIKVFRLMLQSAMLGLGAYIVLQGALSPGAMIASSILMGRALAPIETIIGQWPVLQRAQTGWADLAMLLSAAPPKPDTTKLPTPNAQLDVQSLTLVPPGQTEPSLRMISFSISPGEAVGVIGPSASGKSTLARAITANWRAISGSIRLGTAALDQYEPSELSTYIGYLPQRVQMFDGSIAENIARLAITPDADKVVAAAQRAGAHDMILDLPEGYDSYIAAGRERLSGGQIQRIGLARALYSDPVLLVLDEPNSNLDNIGAEALNAAIRDLKAAKKSVLIMAHRPAAIRECDSLLMLEGGRMKSFGPRDTVLRQVVSNHGDIQPAQTVGGAR